MSNGAEFELRAHRCRVMASSMPFTVLLADDHEEVREAVRDLLAEEFDVLGSVSQGAALVQAASKLRPDVVVTDLCIPVVDGIEAARQILEGGWCQTIVVLTAFDEPALLEKALQIGARGYVSKVDAGEELITAIHTSLNGQRYVSSRLAARMRKK